MTKVKIEKMSWVCGPLNLLPRSNPINSPPRAAIAKGVATMIFKLPLTAEKIAPPPVMMASTPSEVATMDSLVGRYSV